MIPIKTKIKLHCILFIWGISYLNGFAQDAISIYSENHNHIVKNKKNFDGLLINAGDPGWIEKMARRRFLRLKAGNDNTALAAMQVDYFDLPVLLGSYSNLEGSFWKNTINNHLFDNSTETMTGYFEEVSYGQFAITGDVYGWYQADKSVEEYLQEGVAEFCLDISKEADSDVDFSLYDNDGPDGIPNSGDDDGFVDAAMIVFAGVGAEYGNLFNFNSSQLTLYPGYTTDDAAFDGDYLIVRTFVLLAELRENENTPVINFIDVANHEFCHVLGAPDLYDYSDSTNGLGNWCLMSGGVDSHLSAWCKVLLGWVSPVLITNQEDIVLNPVEINPEIYMMWEDGYGLSRYFMLENRQKSIGFESGLPGSGLMIYHVDENNWHGLAYSLRRTQSLSNRLIDLEEADGMDDLDRRRNNGDSGDPFPGSSNKQTFDRRTKPSSDDISGNPTGLSITDIKYLSNNSSISAMVTPREMIGYSIAYDRMGIVNGWDKGNYWGGVLFKIEEAGYLSAVDIGSPYGFYDYKLKIYQTIEDTLPVGLISSLKGHSELPGYHTVDLSGDPIFLEEGQEIFIAYNTNRGIWLDNMSESTGRSYASDNGLGYGNLVGGEWGSVNMNIRARIRYASPVPCDFNADGAVDNADVLALLVYMRDNPGSLDADYNRDGRANILDAFSMLLAQRNGTCESQ